jgi:hypothetical protein
VRTLRSINACSARSSSFTFTSGFESISIRAFSTSRQVPYLGSHYGLHQLD